MSLDSDSQGKPSPDPDGRCADPQMQNSQLTNTTNPTDTSITSTTSSYTDPSHGSNTSSKSIPSSRQSSCSSTSSRHSSPKSINDTTTTSNATNSTRASESKSANSTSALGFPEVQVNQAEEAPILCNPNDLDDDGTPFEDARSSHERGWFSSQDTSFSRGTNYREFATPAAPSAEASVEVVSGLVCSNPCGLLVDALPPTMLLPSSTTDEDSAATAGVLTPQPSSTSTPSPPRAPTGIAAAVSIASPLSQLPRPPPRVRTAAPSGVYGGPGTAYPTVLLKRRLAAFPVVVPDGVDPAEPPDTDPGCLLAAWEAAEATATCGICRRTTGDRFLGYPACNCSHLHARCALVCALLEAPDEPECPSCRRRLRLHRVGRVKPSGRTSSTDGPFSEAWFSMSMITGLSTAAALLAVSVALLLTLIEPNNRGLLTATSHSLMACLFSLLGVAFLACFLIGWLLDRCTAAAWEVYSSRLQIAYCGDRLSSSSERVLAASLMACTFLDYRATSYPYPKRPSAYVNYFCLRQPANV